MADASALDNPYGIAALWTTSGAVGRGVFVILGIMSLYSWYVIITKVLGPVVAAQVRARGGERLLGGIEPAGRSDAPQGRR